MVLERIFGSDSGTDSQLNMDDFNTQLVDKTFSLKFTRHEQKIEFIRAGDPVTIIWDEPEGTRFSSVDKVTRGDVTVEQYKKIIGIKGWFVKSGIVPDPDFKVVHEITTKNVTHRQTTDTTEMQLNMHADIKQWVDDAGVVVKESSHPQDFDSEIVTL